MFWHVSVLPSVCPRGGGGLPISHNALQHFPEWHGADTGGGGRPCQVQLGVGGYLAGGHPIGRGVPCRGVPCWGVPRYGTPPCQVRMGGGEYPVRTTEGVVITRWAVCLLRSRRRTFLFYMNVRLFCRTYKVRSLPISQDVNRPLETPKIRSASYKRKSVAHPKIKLALICI